MLSFFILISLAINDFSLLSWVDIADLTPTVIQN